ncbi:MAG TPA: LemA family protein [Ignavibacteriaceae bacterium]|nr:LemA family protein [Ignavibacteriaceae bacterium]
MIYLILLILLILVWFAFSYNRFVKQKNMISEAWSGIDVQLKRRHDLIPNLVDSVKGYTNYERELFERITDLRVKTMQAASPGEKSRAESGLSGELKNLFAVAENYPDLKASQNFLNLQNQLAETEDQIQFARRYYNGAVRDYNIRVESFPSIIIASIFNYKKEEFFEITLTSEKEPSKVNF